MWLLNLIFGTVLLVQTVLGVSVLNSVHDSKEWWQTASLYQIYPRSYKDTNGDGIGDLKGITQSLSYLKEIGITAAWLSPIYKSPMADFGYDISDYRDIQPEYGTLADFDELVARAHELGMKLLLDYVPNYTSDEHEWFQKSVNREDGFEDFYIWNAGKVDPNDASKRVPPNNWLSCFRGSAWKWNEKRQEFYYHTFLDKQPDLNYRNAKVVEAMNDVMRFWLDRGVDGFRMDAIANLVESAQLLDEPRNPDVDDPDNWNYLVHIYTLDQDETFDMVYNWRNVVEEYRQKNGGDARLLLAETYSPLEKIWRYYGSETAVGAHFPFNFLLVTNISRESTAVDYNAIIHSYLDNMPVGDFPDWVVGNHDQPRLGSRLGENRIDLINILIQALPGTSITYMGEEIGMTNVFLSWEDTVDPAACNSNPEIYSQFSRDPARTPFQWDDTVSAGFSTNEKPWLPVSDNFKTINVASEKDQPGSHLNIYKKMQSIRKSKTLQYGDFTSHAHTDDVLIVTRSLKNEPTYYFIFNFGTSNQIIDLNKIGWMENLHMVLGNKLIQPGTIVTSDELFITDSEVIVLASFV